MNETEISCAEEKVGIPLQVVLELIAEKGENGKAFCVIGVIALCNGR